MTYHKERIFSGIVENVNLSWRQRSFINFLYLVRPTHALKITLKWLQPDTYLHCKRVARLSLAMGKEYNRRFHKCINLKNLEVAGFFHDIGKLGIPNEVLKKKNLSDSDRWLIKKHPELGGLMIRGLLNTSVCSALLSHHEEENGTGYPRGVMREKIPLISRIVSIVDDFCAMTENRGYNKPFSSEAALIDIERNIMGKYDHNMIKVLRTTLALGGYCDLST
ncbi:MAG: HD domain-containing protein [Methanothrix sp.]|nr:MAG: HD domain-containing protein [Methanothrix sp.]